MRKTKYILIALLIFMFLSTIVFAQSTSRRRSSSPSTYQLTVNANVKSYSVLIDGQAIKGNRATVEAGEHEVTVRANGYFDWRQKVNVNSDKTVTAKLQPREYELSVRTNVKGAKIFIDGDQSGQTNFSGKLRPGNYNVRVSEYGYRDYTTTVNLNENMEINVSLEPAYANVEVSINSSILNSQDKGAAGKVEIYVDGNRQKEKSFQLMPGEHSIRIVSGGFAVEESYNFNPDQSYTIEPNLGLSIE